MPDKIYLPVSSTGPCCETHNACDCVLEQLAALRKVAGWARANVDEISCRGDEHCDHCILVYLLAVLRAAEGEDGKDAG